MKINGQDIRIFVCASGTGKTYFSKLDKSFIDIDKYKYMCKYPNFSKDFTDLEIEQIKDKVISKTKLFPDNFIALINKFYNEGKHLLVVPEPLIMEIINKNDWPYVLIYPDKNLKDEYKQRLLQRGNSPEFTMWHDKFFEKYFEQYENDAKATIKVKLRSGEYLSDIIPSLKDK